MSDWPPPEPGAPGVAPAGPTPDAYTGIGRLRTEADLLRFIEREVEKTDLVRTLRRRLVVLEATSVQIGDQIATGRAVWDPAYFLECKGDLVLRTDYPELFAAIGTAYNIGGELGTQFRLPDKRGRASIGAGQGTGLTNRVRGSKTGVESHVLTLAQMPSHNGHGTQMISDSGSGAFWGMAHNEGASLGATYGQDQAHPNMQPSEVDTWIIRAR